MRTVYRTHFELDANNGVQPSLDAVRPKIISWAASRRGVDMVDSDRLGGNLQPTEVGENRHIESRAYEGPLGTAWGLRLTMPDDEPDVIWVTEITVHEKPDGKVWFACSSQVGRQGQTLSPVVRFANRPSIVTDVLTMFPGKGMLPLTGKPLSCGPGDEVMLLVGLLLLERRHLPVVLVSRTKKGEVLTDTKKLADQLAGLAYVIEATSPEVSDSIGRTLPERLNCFDGGVRIYWPGFDDSSSPFHHPLWIKSRILELNERHPARLGSEILNRIASVTTFTAPPSFISWFQLLDWQRSQAIEQAKASNETDVMLALLTEENSSFSAQVRQLKDELELKSQEAAKYKAQADTFRNALQSKESIQVGDVLDASVDSVADVLDIVEGEYADRLAFCWNSKSENDASPFNDPHSVLLALRWLATTYHDSRTGKKECPDREISVREAIPGWSYEPHQSKLTMNHRKYRSWYHTNYNGQEFSLPEHLKCSSTKDARHSIRIAFNWDEKSKKVVLGYLGQHQQTTAS
jgi:hypothetical protein